jgi:hypothetical protein
LQVLVTGVLISEPSTNTLQARHNEHFIVLCWLKKCLNQQSRSKATAIDMRRFSRPTPRPLLPVISCTIDRALVYVYSSLSSRTMSILYTHGHSHVVCLSESLKYGKFWGPYCRKTQLKQMLSRYLHTSQNIHRKNRRKIMSNKLKRLKNRRKSHCFTIYLMELQLVRLSSGIKNTFE